MENPKEPSDGGSNSSNPNTTQTPATTVQASASQPPVSAAPAATTPSAPPAPADLPAGETAGLQPEQAAEVSDSAVQPSVPPKLTREQQRRAKKWSNDNRRSFRSDDEIDSMIARECDANNCTESEAVKTLIRRGAGKEVVRIRPHSDPEDLRRLVAAAHELARTIRSVRSRLNAPLGAGQGDEELTKLLVEWRRIAKELPPKLDQFLPNLRKLITAVTSLTPGIVINARKIESYLTNAESESRSKSKAENNAELGQLADAYRSVIELLTSMGIFLEKPPCPPQK
ncbi:hypothetical protein BH09VER1_BH09VER1_53260 [soil metagenome]